MVFVEALVAAVTFAGWGLGILMHWATPGRGQFAGECALWLAVVVTLARVMEREIRTSLIAAIPR
jgi:hypothetical protein